MPDRRRPTSRPATSRQQAHEPASVDSLEFCAVPEQHLAPGQHNALRRPQGRSLVDNSTPASVFRRVVCVRWRMAQWRDTPPSFRHRAPIDRSHRHQRDRLAFSAGDLSGVTALATERTPRGATPAVLRIATFASATLPARRRRRWRTNRDHTLLVARQFLKSARYRVTAVAGCRIGFEHVNRDERTAADTRHGTHDVQDHRLCPTARFRRTTRKPTPRRGRLVTTGARPRHRSSPDEDRVDPARRTGVFPGSWAGVASATGTASRGATGRFGPTGRSPG